MLGPIKVLFWSRCIQKIVSVSAGNCTLQFKASVSQLILTAKACCVYAPLERSTEQYYYKEKEQSIR